MPPGVAGSGDSGSGASRVHRTKPSGRGAPGATPSENGAPPLQRPPPAKAPESTAGAAASPIRPAPAPPMKRRRSRGEERKDDVRADDIRENMAAPHWRKTSALKTGRNTSSFV